MQVRNTSSGARGAYLAGVYVEAEPGDVIEVDDYAPDWFEVVPAKLGRPAKPAE